MTNRNKKIMDTTDNRSVYNKTRKVYLERKGLIRCSWCAYHHGENEENKYYGTKNLSSFFISRNLISWKENIGNFRYPSWKLVSKNKKQWMKKPIIRKKKHYHFFEDYYSLEF